jgi:hypothetical protein
VANVAEVIDTVAVDVAAAGEQRQIHVVAAVGEDNRVVDDGEHENHEVVEDRGHGHADNPRVQLTLRHL